MKEPRKTKRSRAILWLLLYLLSAGAATRVIADAPDLAQKLGALCVPVGCLIAGCWFAYKDGGRAARIFASVLVLLGLGSFGFGVIRGYEHQQAAHEVNAELDQIRGGLIADSSDDSSASEAAQRHRDRTEDAARRLQASDNEQTAALGRAMQSITQLTQASDERLGSAIDAVCAESFLDVVALLDSGDFAAQRLIALEYQAAAREICAVYKDLPASAEREFAAAGLNTEQLAEFMVGFRKTWPLSMRVFQSHLATADGYLGMIDFVAEHAESISMNEDGELEFADDQIGDAYAVVCEEVDSASTRTNQAIDALRAAIAKR